MSRPSCRIYGHDGFDRDVLHNLTRFYRGLGHRVALGSRAGAADLLVVQRAPDAPIDFRPFRAVHVWDYVGTPIDRMLTGPGVDDHVTVFTSSEQRAAALRRVTEVTVQVLVPPVAVPLWRRTLHPVTHQVVHIGNHKPYYREGSDAFASRFAAAIAALGAEVWGAGWPGGTSGLHGPLPQFRASHVYRSSAVALGMMYPFQRAVSFSGRFWHAPLNGCRLLSEPSVYAGSWPGVQATDYTADDLRTRLAPPAESRQELQDHAVDFWAAHWLAAREQVSAAGQRTGMRRSPLSLVDLAASTARLAAQRVRG